MVNILDLTLYTAPSMILLSIMFIFCILGTVENGPISIDIAETPSMLKLVDNDFNFILCKTHSYWCRHAHSYSNTITIVQPFRYGNNNRIYPGYEQVTIHNCLDLGKMKINYYRHCGGFRDFNPSGCKAKR